MKKVGETGHMATEWGRRDSNLGLKDSPHAELSQLHFQLKGLQGIWWDAGCTFFPCQVSSVSPLAPVFGEHLRGEHALCDFLPQKEGAGSYEWGWVLEMDPVLDQRGKSEYWELFLPLGSCPAVWPVFVSSGWCHKWPQIWRLKKEMYSFRVLEVGSRKWRCQLGSVRSRGSEGEPFFVFSSFLWLQSFP